MDSTAFWIVTSKIQKEGFIVKKDLYVIEINKKLLELKNELII